jgi:enoyl-CoA hydratase/carnithine racemase/succinyl-CoA synthetase alpha subunit
LARLFQPRSIVLVGATDRSFWSVSAFDNLKRFEYPGRIHLVNPKGGTVHGLAAATGCAAVGEPIDSALLMVPEAALPDTFEDLRAAGIAGAVILSSGFAEIGAEGAARQQALAAQARAAGIRLIGPNCLGFANFVARTPLWTTPLRRPMPNASLAIVSQSGALAGQLEQFAYQQRIALTHMVSTGNEADLTVADAIDYLAGQPEPRAIALFLESVRDPAQFIAATEAARNAGKPVVVLKVGSSEAAAKAAGAHRLAGRLRSRVRRAMQLARTNPCAHARGTGGDRRPACPAAPAGQRRPGADRNVRGTVRDCRRPVRCAGSAGRRARAGNKGRAGRRAGPTRLVVRTGRYPYQTLCTCGQHPGGTGRAAADYSVQPVADRKRGPVPAVLEHYEGPATVETYTVQYGTDGEPIQGIVVLRTAEGARTIARVPTDDNASMALLTMTTRTAIGTAGEVRIDVFGKPVWQAGTSATHPARTRKYTRVERDGALTIITIDRPQAMNSLHPPANAELAELFNEFAADPEQWVAIITGAGERAFSAGNDLKYSAQAVARGAPIDVPLSGFGGLSSRFDLAKPVIAAVNGVAMGGGFEIALACDLIIAAETAVFALPEPRVGLAALAGGVHRLPRQIGMKQAMGMILTGRRVSAIEGRELGFVNEVVAPGELMNTARRWAAQIIECSPMSVRASKEMVQRGLDEPTLADACVKQYGYPTVLALLRSADAVEGPKAFAQKRPPRWQGR